MPMPLYFKRSVLYNPDLTHVSLRSPCREFRQTNGAFPLNPENISNISNAKWDHPSYSLNLFSKIDVTHHVE